MHHIEDLEKRGLAGADFPLFKGQYNSGAKKCGIRNPFPPPERFKPGIDAASIMHGGPLQTVEAAVASIFDDHYKEHADLSFWAGTEDPATNAEPAAPYSRHGRK